MSTNPTLAIEVESITPAKAQKYLATNTNNRSLRVKRVKQYAEQMQRGQWQLVGDPIRFDTSGTLLDGQHRLHAVVMSGAPTDFVVVRNIPADSFVVIDSGLNRTPGDGLGNGVAASSHKAAAIRVLYVIEAGGDPRKTEDASSVTRQDIHDYYSNTTSEVEEATHVGQQMYSTLHGNRSAWIALAYMTGRIDITTRNQFLDGLRTGAGLQTGDPRLALRNWLLQKANKKYDRSGDHLALYIKAWNEWLNGQRRTIMRLVAGDDPFPTISANVGKVVQP